MPQVFSGDNLTPLDVDLTNSMYSKLRRIAEEKLAGERVGHTLQATALVHEALMKLGDPGFESSQHRGRFYIAAAEAMRRVLIDHARAKQRVKRGGKVNRVDWTAAIAESADFSGILEVDDLEALDEAIRRLQERDRRAGDVIRLKFFAGLSLDQIAVAMGISPRTAKREWEYSRAWLLKELKERVGTNGADAK